MDIKIAEEKDLPIIKKLAETIWPVCYKDVISPEQITYMLDLIYSMPSLKSQLQKGHQFIIALQNDAPVGFASFSKKSDTEYTTFRLHKLYVLTTLQTKGIGSFLLDVVTAQSKSAGAVLLELNVNKHNPSIKFYNKKGFNIVKEEVIDIGNGYVMDDYVMAKTL